MPNWSFNKVNIEGDKDSIRKLYDTWIEKAKRVDFKDFPEKGFSLNLLVESPKCLEGTASPTPDEVIHIFNEMKELTEDPSFEVTEEAISTFADKIDFSKSSRGGKTEIIKGVFAKIKTGYENWYDWNVQNWGTRWDCTTSTPIEIDNDEITFDLETAWCPPLEAFRTFASSDECPNNILFKIDCVNEGSRGNPIYFIEKNNEGEIVEWEDYGNRDEDFYGDDEEEVEE